MKTVHKPQPELSNWAIGSGLGLVVTVIVGPFTGFNMTHSGGGPEETIPFLLLGPWLVLSGWMGWTEIKKNPKEKKGKFLAGTGLLVGSLLLLFTAATLAEQY